MVAMWFQYRSSSGSPSSSQPLVRSATVSDDLTIVATALGSEIEVMLRAGALFRLVEIASLLKSF